MLEISMTALFTPKVPTPFVCFCPPPHLKPYKKKKKNNKGNTTLTFTENLDSMTTVSLFYTILNEFAVMISVCVRSDCLDLSLLSFYQWLVRVVVVPSQLRGTILYSKDSYFVFKWKCIFYLFFF